MATTRYRHRRSADPALAFPALIEPGEIAVNTSNRQLAVGDAAAGSPGVIVPLLAVRFFDTRGGYLVGDYVTNSGFLYRCKVAHGPGVAFDPAHFEMVTGADAIVGASMVTNVPAGNISATNVQAALNELDNEKAPINSPAFTGTPTAPTPSAADSSTKIATTAFVQSKSTPAAAPDTAIQFNDGGAFAGDAALTFDKTVKNINLRGGGGLNTAPATGPARLYLNPIQAGQQAFVGFYENSVLKWEIGKHTDNSYMVYDAVNGRFVINAVAGGDLVLNPIGNINFIKDVVASGGATFNGSITTRGLVNIGPVAGTANITIGPSGPHSCIELGDLSGAAAAGSNMPFFDWHYSTGVAQDYNFRMQNAADGSMYFTTANGPCCGFVNQGTYNALIMSLNGSYINFGNTFGLSGWGIRDNGAGVVEIKNFGGNWGSPLSAGSPATITKGFAVQPYNIGTGSGTLTPDPANSNYQYVTNGGAFTIAPPNADCSIDILVTNGASAGAITFTAGFKAPAGGGGDPYLTNAGFQFILMIRRIAAVSTFCWKALQ